MCLYVSKWTFLGKDVQFVIANKHLKVKRDIWAGNKSFRIKEWVVNEGVRMYDIAQEDLGRREENRTKDRTLENFTI